MGHLYRFILAIALIMPPVAAHRAHAEGSTAKKKQPTGSKGGGIAAGLDDGTGGKRAPALGDLLDKAKAKAKAKAKPPAPIVRVVIRVLGKPTTARRQLQEELGHRRARCARCFATARQRRKLERFSGRFTLNIDRRGKADALPQHPKDPLQPKRTLVLRPMIWLCLENVLEAPLSRGPFLRPTAGRYEVSISLEAPKKARKPKKKFNRRVFAPGHAR